jgi:hypothetical protein
MPTVTRTMIKTALAHVMLGTALSTLWLIHLVRPIHPLLAYLQPTALHLIVVGWLTQLIFGVALWMFPVWSREQPRGPEGFIWACYGLLNAGLLLRLMAEPLNAYGPTAALGALLVASSIMQVAAVLIFIGLIWPRVRPKGSPR